MLTDDTDLLVYFYGPIGILCLCNLVLVMHTCWSLRTVGLGLKGFFVTSDSSRVFNAHHQTEYNYYKRSFKQK